MRPGSILDSVVDVGRKGAGERLGALYQDAELAGPFLVPLHLSNPGVLLAPQLVGETLEAGYPLGEGGPLDGDLTRAGDLSRAAGQGAVTRNRMLGIG